MCVIVHLGNSGVRICLYRAWALSAICRCRSTSQMAIFVEDSWYIYDIDTREYVDFCWWGTLRWVRRVDNTASRASRTWSIQRG